MPQLYLIRHGQTDYNLNGIVQGGGIDSSLNDTGRSQGERFFNQYRNAGFDQVYCSGLKRTYETVLPFEEEGHSIVRVPELNELNWGVFEGVKGSPQLKEAFTEINAVWESGNIHHAIEGGESPAEGWARAEKGIQKIVAESKPDSKVLVCAHGRIIRIMLSGMLGYGLQRMNVFHHDNTGLNLLVRQTNGRWIAERLNDLSHLQ